MPVVVSEKQISMCFILFLAVGQDIWCLSLWKKKGKCYTKHVLPMASTLNMLFSMMRSKGWTFHLDSFSSFGCSVRKISTFPFICFCLHFFHHCLSLPILLHCDSESDSPSSLRIECSFMIVLPLSNQLNRLLVKLSKVTWMYTVKMKTA